MVRQAHHERRSEDFEKGLDHGSRKLRRKMPYAILEQSGRGVAQPGSAPAWGAGGRQFESGRPDHFTSPKLRGTQPASLFAVQQVQPAQTARSLGISYRSISHRSASPVDHHLAAGYERGFVGRQVDDRKGDIFGSTNSPQGRALPLLFIG